MSRSKKADYAKVISCYAADTSGVCSALYEYGGLVCVHDASGCNSTYTTHDEPRWYDKKSMIYISAMTEMDAVMGNDQKLIDDITRAAAQGKPEFIAVCGSPMAMMTGVDFDAVAMEAENITGIKSFGIDTNGIRSYIWGAGRAFAALAEIFCEERPKAEGIGVNILGATPLDFSVNGSVSSIKEWLAECGFKYISCFGMDSDLDEIKNAAAASVNLVVSQSVMETAEYFYSRFGIPYVCAVPVGKKFSYAAAESLRTAAKTGHPQFPCAENRNGAGEITIIGEGIFSSSLAAAITLEEGINCKVICPLECGGKILSEGDLTIFSEEDIEKACAMKDCKAIIADPLYKPVCTSGKVFYSLPHEAFSGRCFRKDIPNLINRSLKDVI